MNEPFILNNTGGGMGGAAPQVYMKLTTLTEDFDYDFKEYGEYKISIFGTVLDMKGREYSLNGDFTVVKSRAVRFRARCHAWNAIRNRGLFFATTHRPARCPSEG